MAKHLSKAERKKTIYNSALRLIAKKGFEKTTIDEMAIEAGCSKGTFYYYFKSKDDLFEKLQKEMEDNLLGEVRKMIEDNQSAEMILRNWLGKFKDIIEDEYLMKASLEFFTHSIRDNSNITKLTKDWHGLIGLMQQIIEMGIKNKEFRPDIDAYKAAIFLALLGNGNKLFSLLKLDHALISDVMIEYGINQLKGVSNEK